MELVTLRMPPFKDDVSVSFEFKLQSFSLTRFTTQKCSKILILFLCKVLCRIKVQFSTLQAELLSISTYQEGGFQFSINFVRFLEYEKHQTPIQIA